MASDFPTVRGVAQPAHSCVRPPVWRVVRLTDQVSAGTLLASDAPGAPDRQ